MIINYKTSPCGLLEIVPTPEEYDAFPPVRSLICYQTPENFNADRLAVATYLAFGPWTSGQLTFPEAISPSTADAIEKDASPQKIRPYPIEYSSRQLPAGNRTMHFRKDITTTPNGQEYVIVLPTAKATGALHMPNLSMLSSNAFIIDSARELPYRSINAQLGAIAVYADVLALRTIIVPNEQIADNQLYRLRALFATVNLELRVEGEPSTI